MATESKVWQKLREGRGCRELLLAAKNLWKWKDERGYWELPLAAREWRLGEGLARAAVSYQEMTEMGGGEKLLEASASCQEMAEMGGGEGLP